MATKRLNSKKVVRLNKKNNETTRDAVKARKKVEVIQDYPDELRGRTVVLKSIPGGIKKADKLFKVGRKYKIEKPVKKNFRNTGMAVHLKGKDGNVYEISFAHWMLLPDSK